LQGALFYPIVSDRFADFVLQLQRELCVHSSSPNSWLSLARFELPTIEHPVSIIIIRVPLFNRACVSRWQYLWYRPSDGKRGRLLGCGAAEGFATVVWQHSQPRTFLLQSTLVPSLHYGCGLWGMHGLGDAARKPRTAIQTIHDRYLRHICRVKYATPSAMLLGKTGIVTSASFLVAADS